MFFAARAVCLEWKWMLTTSMKWLLTSLCIFLNFSCFIFPPSWTKPCSVSQIWGWEASLPPAAAIKKHAGRVTTIFSQPYLHLRVCIFGILRRTHFQLSPSSFQVFPAECVCESGLVVIFLHAGAQAACVISWYSDFISWWDRVLFFFVLEKS